MELALVAAVLFLAFVNGANDNLKGVATLYGSGGVSYRGAVAFATLTTAAGSLASLSLAAALVAAFSGKGLVPPELLDAALLTAVAAGAATTVLVATRIGMPISTTHAIVGALLGAGAVVAGSELNLAALGSAFLLPLAVGPVFAIALAAALSRGGDAASRNLGLDANSCVCIEEGFAPSHTGAVARSALALEVAHRDDCAARDSGGALRLDVASAIDAGHWLSAGAVGFARGLNDTPKILGLLVGGAAISPIAGAAAITGVMALGGILAARRVTETMALRITPMTSGQGLAGNLATSALVISASRFGLPVSTTHVSAGGIVGIGASSGTLRAGMTSAIAGAWLATLPLAAALGALFAWATGPLRAWALL